EGLGYQGALRRLSDPQRAEIRSVGVAELRGGSMQSRLDPKPLTRRAVMSDAVQRTIKDDQLLGRERDLILAPRHYDRPISEATKVLEDRIRRVARPDRRLDGVNLVNYAFNESLEQTILRVSDDPSEQRGYTQILRGVVGALRNRTHHEVV